MRPRISIRHFSVGRSVGWSVGGRLVGWSVGRLVCLSIPIMFEITIDLFNLFKMVHRFLDASTHLYKTLFGWSVCRLVGVSVGWSPLRLKCIFSAVSSRIDLKLGGDLWDRQRGQMDRLE